MKIEFKLQKPEHCQMPECQATAETCIKAKPPYVLDDHKRQIKWFWMCLDHGEELLAKGYEPTETLF